MAEYTYLASARKVELFLRKIQEVGVPTKVTQAWLTSIGFTSKNDRPLVSLMRQIGFVDESGRPTAAWTEFRGGSLESLANGIQQGYQSLYAVYSDAHRRSSAELESVVKSTAPRLGKDAVARVLSTFRALTDFAKMDEISLSSTEATSTDRKEPDPADEDPLTPLVRSFGSGVTINVNVQLTLPETTDSTVYDKLFSAMREHLLNGAPYAD